MLTTHYHQTTASLGKEATLPGQNGCAVCMQDSDREEDKKLLLQSFKVYRPRINGPKKQEVQLNNKKTFLKVRSVLKVGYLWRGHYVHACCVGNEG